MIRFALLAFPIVLLAAARQEPPPPPPAPQGTPKTAPPTWGDIGPIFAERCTGCHGGEGPTRGLDLGTLAGALRGSKSGPVLVSGKPQESELVARIRGESEPRMPLDGPPYLDDTQIRRVEEWVRAGLPDAPAKPAEPAKPEGGGAPPGEKERTPEPEKPRVPAAGEPVTWAHVAPIFAKRCVKCHKDGGDRGAAPEGLQLISLERVLAGGERIAVIPGNAAASPVVRHIRGIATPRMPLDGPPFLSDEEIALIERWIAGGALDSAGARAKVPAGREVRYRGRLTGTWQIDGIDVVVDGSTRIDEKKRPRVGDEAEVRGVILADGRIRATRLRRR